MHARRLSGPLLALSIATGICLTACGGGGGSSGGGGGAASLVSIEIEPGFVKLPWGFTLQLTARGHYSDSTTANLTSQALWTSGNPAAATVGDAAGNKGLVTGITAGDALVTATFATLSGTRIAHVIDPVLTQIVISPSTVEMAVGAKKAFTCEAFYQGGYSTDVTDNVSWSSTDTSVATIVNAGASKGVATAVAVGDCQIKAVMALFQDTSDLSAIEVQVLDSAVGSQKDATAPCASIDATGKIVTAWSYQGIDPGMLFWRRYTPGVGWNGKQQVATLTGKALAPVIAGNDSGVRFLAWSSADELWAARFDSGLWGSPLLLASGSTSDQFAVDTALGVFANGDALLIWRSTVDDQLRAKVYVEGAGWGATSTLGGVGSSAHPIAFASNAEGDAMLLWQNYSSATWTLEATRFTSAGGFEAPYVLYSSALYHQPAVALDSLGNAIATWVDFTPFPQSHLLAAHYTVGTGWEASELVSDLDVPREPRVGLDDAGNACTLWRHATIGGTGISASRFVPGTGWEERTLLKDSPQGAPDPLPPHLDGLGDIIAYWSTDSAAEGVKLELARYTLGVGWAPAESFDFIGAEGPVRDLKLAVHSNGASIVTWSEARSAGDFLLAHRFE
jgi:hypothetical protein